MPLLPLLLAAACAPPPVDTPEGDSAAVDSAGDDARDSAGSAPGFFEPAGMYLADFQVAWRGAALGAFTIPPDTVVQPYVTLYFATREWFATADPAGLCAWRGAFAARDLDTSGPEAWVRFQADLTLASTDCAGFDPAAWPGGDPTDTLEHTPVVMTLGMPTQRLAADFGQFAEGHDVAFPSAWSDYVLGAGFAFQDEAGADTHAEEMSWAVVRALDPAGTLLEDDAGNAELVPLGGRLPEGAVRGYGFYSSAFSGVAGSGQGDG